MFQTTTSASAKSLLSVPPAGFSTSAWGAATALRPDTSVLRPLTNTNGVPETGALMQVTSQLEESYNGLVSASRLKAHEPSMVTVSVNGLAANATPLVFAQ